MKVVNMKESLYTGGHTACAGCGAIIAIHEALRALGDDIIIVNATGCMEIVSSKYPDSPWKVPYIHCLFENAASVATGVSAYLRGNGNDHTQVVVIAGDGATYDIGFGCLSGMLERNDDVIYICYDNEAYMNCLTKDALIMTENGLQKITEIKEGDLLYSFDLNTKGLVLKKCSGVYDNGNKEIFEVNTLHHFLKATGNHPFLIVEHNGRGRTNKLVWKTVEELKVGDETVVSKNFEEGKSFVFPKVKIISKNDYKVNKLNEVRIPEKSSPEIMEYLGIYLGDGWVRNGRGEIGFSLIENTKERRDLIQLHKKIFGGGINPTKNEVHINSINLANFINSLGFGSGAKNKLIPSWVFTLPQEEKEAFIKGLLASDGYELGKSKRYVSASFELLRRLRLLLQTAGYRVGKIHKQMKKKGVEVVKRKLLKDSEYGYICFSKLRKWNTKKYYSQYKYANLLIDNEYFSVEKITEIKKLGHEATLDLQVEGSHNFIANGYVVHNTGVQRSGSTPKGARTTTSQIGTAHIGKEASKKPIVEIAAAHGIPYAASASISYPADFENKLKKAAKIKGAKFINVFAPCVPGWGTKENASVELGRLAVTSGMWALIEIENGKLKINLKPEFTPVADYLKKQDRFKHFFKPENSHMLVELENSITKRWENLRKIEML